MTNWGELPPHERIKLVADMLNSFLEHHTYTEWESNRLAELADILEITGVEIQEQFKRLNRSSGGLNNKVRAQGNEIRKLEARLGELESRGCGYCEGHKDWPEHESKLDSIVR